VARGRDSLRVIVELSESAEPVDSEAVADALVRDLATGEIQGWCDEVRAAIAASRAALQSQLEELNDGPDTVERR